MEDRADDEEVLELVEEVHVKGDVHIANAGQGKDMLPQINVLVLKAKLHAIISVVYQELYNGDKLKEQMGEVF